MSRPNSVYCARCGAEVSVPIIGRISKYCHKGSDCFKERMREYHKDWRGVSCKKETSFICKECGEKQFVEDTHPGPLPERCLLCKIKIKREKARKYRLTSGYKERRAEYDKRYASRDKPSLIRKDALIKQLISHNVRKPDNISAQALDKELSILSGTFVEPGKTKISPSDFFKY